ncbi:MAG: GntR family transcriptional regulator [Pseudomonadota bacterium]
MYRNTKPNGTTAPRFRRIVDRLRAEIIAGRLPEHAALPSERAVAGQHGVSRMTARRALEAMEAEGLAYSAERKGRFVSPPRLNYPVSSMANFLTDAEKNGVDLEVQVIATGERTADAALAGILAVPEGEALSEVTRLFLNGGHATFLETEYVLASLYADLLEAHDAATKPLAEQRFSPFGHDADIVIRMRPLSAEEAELLGLSPNQAGIEAEQLVRDETGQAFCFSRQIWRGELAQFSARAIVNR